MFQVSPASGVRASLHGAIMFCNTGFRDNPAVYRKTRSCFGTILTMLAHRIIRAG